MTSTQVLTELKKLRRDNIKQIFLRHGAKEPLYGVRIKDIKKVMKQITGDRQAVAKELFASGVGEAQYLAGLMADGSKLTKSELQSWVRQAKWSMVTDYAVPWVACENEDAVELALKWIDSKDENIASAGWCTLSSVVATWDDADLDLPLLKKLLGRVEKEIHSAMNRVKYSMNTFVIATGSYVKELSPLAISVGKKIGDVEVDMGDTSCKVPSAPDYIKKVIDRGKLGKKKRTAKC